MGFFTKLAVLGAAVVGARALLANASTSDTSATDQSEEKKPKTREVYIVTSEVDVSGIKISRAVHQYLAGKFGFTETSISHWGILLVDNERRLAIQYDLMSEEAPSNRLRVRKLIPKMLEEWTGAVYVGETTKTDTEIVQFGKQFINDVPDYDLVVANCQTFVARLLTYICNVQVIDEASLEAVVKNVGPDVAMFVSVTRFISNVVMQVGRAYIDEFKALKDAVEEATIFK